jgi:exonuclease III
MEEQNIDILLIQETNTTQRAVYTLPALTSRRICFTNDRPKQLGYGCGIIVSHRLAPHLILQEAFGANMCTIKLQFTRLQIQIVNVYWPAQRDDPAIVPLTQIINNLLQDQTNNHNPLIFGGDWNSYINGQLDHFPPTLSSHPRTVLPLFETHSMIDVYRHLYPEGTNMTHTSKVNNAITTGSRLDSFWVDYETLQKVTRYSIDSLESSIISDHAPVYIELEFTEIVNLAPEHIYQSK